MDRQYGEFVGVDSLYVALVTEDTEAAFTAETPEYLAPSAEIAVETETENTPTYYDNVPGFNYTSEGITTATLTVSGVPADKLAKYLGKHYSEADGRVYDTGEPNPPEVALSFRFNRGPDSYRYFQYLKGTFSGGAEEAASKSPGVDVKTYQLTFTAVVTSHKWTIGGEEKGLKRIFGDSTDINFSAADWFAQVQTPPATP